MSRNFNNKKSAPAAKASRRRDSTTSESSLDLSGTEDGYSALGDFSDSEDNDEDDVKAVEERDILMEDTPASTPRPIYDAEGDEDKPFGFYDSDYKDDADLDADLDGGVDLGEEDSASWNGIMSEPGEESQVSDFYNDAVVGTTPHGTRRVRFANVPSSESDDSTDTEDDHGSFFPDIFISQNNLDPSFRRDIERDPDDSSDSGSFWEVDQTDESIHGDTEEVPRDFPRPQHASSAVDDVFNPQTSIDTLMSSDLEDGYDTDGETTEEDEPDLPRPKVARRPLEDMGDDDTDSDSDTSAAPTNGGPRVKRFDLDRHRNKPLAVFNPATRKMMIFTPQPRPQLSPNQMPLEQDMLHGWPDESPMFSNSANMMFSAMFAPNDFENLINGQAIGPPEAFIPGVPPTDDYSSDSFGTENTVRDDDDIENELNLGDFVQFGDSEDESVNETAEKGRSTTNGRLSSTPARPTTASSDFESLPQIDPRHVGAFRRNQLDQQLLLSNQATQDSLAFSGPYNNTAIRGLRSDRFDTAGVPLTPARRRKGTNDNFRSPLDTLSAKRKASSDANSGNHKKQRSISDVNNLHI